MDWVGERTSLRVVMQEGWVRNWDQFVEPIWLLTQGGEVNQRGGFQALQCNYYVIQAALRDAGVAEQATDIMLIFEKVTPEWRA